MLAELIPGLRKNTDICLKEGGDYFPTCWLAVITTSPVILGREQNEYGKCEVHAGIDCRTEWK